MKNYIRMFLLFACIIMLLPMALVSNNPSAHASGDNLNSIADISVVNMTDKATGEEYTITLREYLIGSVMAQMPAYFDYEALKAQTVINHTSLLYDTYCDYKSSMLEGYAFMSESDARAYYGDKYDEAYEKVSFAVDESIEYVCTYNSELIMMPFHAVSAGKTENAGELLNVDIPYLRCAESSWDGKIQGSVKSVTMPVKEANSRLSVEFSLRGDNLYNEIEVVSKTSAGSVKELSISGQSVSVKKFAELFSLPSENFSVSVDGGNLCITTVGVGHLLGMSQHGANIMAGDGADFKEILEHYYYGIKITEIF